MRYLLLSTAILFVGCGQEPITIGEEPKEALPAAGSREGRHDGESAGITWRMPAGWKEASGHQMRLATFRTPSGAEVSVVALAGEAGGDIANVNRWREQLGLPPIQAKDLPRASRELRAPAGSVLVVDLEGEGARMLAARLMHAGTSYFFKLTGTPDAVGGAREQFESFLRSLSHG